MNVKSEQFFLDTVLLAMFHYLLPPQRSLGCERFLEYLLGFSSVDRSAESCFRRKSEKLESYISFANGRSQFWCPENCYVLIKADNNQPMRLSSTEVETNGPYIFIHPASKLLAVVNRSETLNIEVPIFEEGRDVLHFKVEGISWK